MAQDAMFIPPTPRLFRFPPRLPSDNGGRSGRVSEESKWNRLKGGRRCFCFIENGTFMDIIAIKVFFRRLVDRLSLAQCPGIFGNYPNKTERMGQHPFLGLDEIALDV